MKVLFMGTPEFASESLKALANSEYDICGVFTQPDKPKGRGYKLAFSPVKEFALENGLKVFQPSKLKTGEAFEIIKDLNPDIIVVVAYGKILPKEIIDFPKYGCVNVHGSLLPKYRGAAPIQWSVINGETKTGVTTMYMDEGLDTGDMLLKESVDVLPNETSGELYERLAKIGANLLIKTLNKIEDGTILPEKQNDDDFTYAPMLNKDMALIDWTKKAKKIHDLVRGLNPWPITYSYIGGKRLKIYKTEVLDNYQGLPGEIVNTSPLIVACGDNTALKILEVLYEGKKRMKSEDFLRGYKVESNMKLGE